ncbi:MAG TPA: DUF4097 family beta strand repeat-containing protein [Feifaniaceae bacterium]|nr:DUF4097 family beta strand repeat-containing protein [Feifaniaceae bacterium]
MNKKNSLLTQIIVWGVVAFLLLSAFTVLLSRSASGFSGLSANSWDSLRTIQEESFPLESVNELEFDFSSMDITVYPTKEEDLTVKLLANRDLRPEELFVSSAENGKVLVKSRPHRSFFWMFSFGAFKRLEIHLPERYAESLNIETSSGNITLPETLALHSLALHLSSGNLSAGDIHTEEFALGLTSGNIRLDALNSARYEMRITSGDTEVGAVRGTGSIGSSSGNIRVGSVSGGAQDISTASGNIRLDGFTGHGEISTQSGNIRAEEALLTGDLDVRVTSGSASIALAKEAEANIEASVTSGDIDSDIPLSYDKQGRHATGQVGENPANTLFVRTTSGDVRISRAE